MFFLAICRDYIETVSVIPSLLTLDMAQTDDDNSQEDGLNIRLLVIVAWVV